MVRDEDIPFKNSSDPAAGTATGSFDLIEGAYYYLYLLQLSGVVGHDGIIAEPYLNLSNSRLNVHRETNDGRLQDGTGSSTATMRPWLTFVVTDATDWSEMFTFEVVNADNQLGYRQFVGDQFKLILSKPVPEPATMSLLALGGLALLRRRARASWR